MYLSFLFIWFWVHLFNPTNQEESQKKKMRISGQKVSSLLYLFKIFENSNQVEVPLKYLQPKYMHEILRKEELVES